MAGVNPSLLCLMAITLAICSFGVILTSAPFPQDGKVMMEYIGATGVPVSFDSVPIDANIDFHFLLGFAIDANPAGKPQNGVFSPYWASTITPAAIKSIKARHSKNVKVLASLSGWSVGSNVLSWYNPSNPESWVSNAFTSLRSLITKYHLDGIDVDYEVFPKKDTTFAYCIGELITRLKTHRVITVATVAPYYQTAGYYAVLYRRYPTVIDYVNYQFYTDRAASPWAFVRDFKLRAAQFYAPKVLPSYEVKGRGIQGDGFFTALGMLESSGYEVNGVMIFSADDSESVGFYYEKKSQAFLLNPKAIKRNSTMLV